MRNKLELNIDIITTIFINENEYQYVVWKVMAIFLSLNVSMASCQPDFFFK